MRRAMLTLGVAPPAALTPIGRDPNAGSLLSAGSNTLLWTDLAAVEAGTITEVEVDFATAFADVAFFTISSTNVIRDISANMAASAGIATYAVSLAVQPGDRIGLWKPNNTISALRLRDYGGSGTYYRYNSGTTTKPNIGDTRNPTNTGSAGHGYGMLATGTQ